MPQRNQRPNEAPKEPIENLKDLLGFKWSTIIYWLIGLIPAAFLIGIRFGIYISDSGNNYKLTEMSLKHQKEIFEAKEEGRKQALEEQKHAKEQAEYLLTMIQQANKKK